MTELMLRHIDDFAVLIGLPDVIPVILYEINGRFRYRNSLRLHELDALIDRTFAFRRGDDCDSIQSQLVNGLRLCRISDDRCGRICLDDVCDSFVAQTFLVCNLVNDVGVVEVEDNGGGGGGCVKNVL